MTGIFEYDSSLKETPNYRDFLFKQSKLSEVVSFEQFEFSDDGDENDDADDYSMDKNQSQHIEESKQIDSGMDQESPSALVANMETTPHSPAPKPLVVKSVNETYKAERIARIRKNCTLLFRLKYFRDQIIHPTIEDPSISALNSTITFKGNEISSEVNILFTLLFLR